MVADAGTLPQIAESVYAISALLGSSSGLGGRIDAGARRVRTIFITAPQPGHSMGARGLIAAR